MIRWIERFVPAYLAAHQTTPHATMLRAGPPRRRETGPKPLELSASRPSARD